jgi:hypothetical protein
MELLMIAGTGFVAAASLAAGIGIGYLALRAATAALERLFTASSPGATIVPFVAPSTHEVHGLRRAA